MNLFRDISFRNKLAGGFALIILVVGILSFIVLRTYQDVGNEFTFLEKDAIPPAVLLLQINADINLLRAELEDVLLSEEEERTTAENDQIDDIIAALRESLALHTKYMVRDVDLNIARQLEADGLEIISLSLLVLKKDEEQKQAQATLLSDMEQLESDVNALIEILDEHANEHIDDFDETAALIYQEQAAGEPFLEPLDRTLNVIVPETVSILKIEKKLALLRTEVEVMVASRGDTRRRVEEAITEFQEELSIHAAHAQLAGEEGIQAAHEITSQGLNIINNTRVIMDQVDSLNQEQVFFVGFLEQLGTDTKAFEENLEVRVDDHLAELNTSIETMSSTQTRGRLGVFIGSAAALLIALVAGYVITRSTLGPINQLVGAVRRISAGDLDTIAPVIANDEIGTLAIAFNEMTARVSARTRDLQIAAQVVEQATTIHDPDELLSQVVELVKDNFGLYHAHIYLSGVEDDHLVMSAGAGEAGRIMKERGHRIATDADSLVAYAAREDQIVVADDVMLSENFLANPLLPLTRSEAAFPLTVAGQVLGVLDVQSDQVAWFDENLQAVLATLADQMAISLDGARLFSEVERASRHERALSAITQEIQRANSIDEVLQLATRELGKALRVPRASIELQLRLDDVAAEPESEM